MLAWAIGSCVSLSATTNRCWAWAERAISMEMKANVALLMVKNFMVITTMKVSIAKIQIFPSFFMQFFVYLQKFWDGAKPDKQKKTK